MDIYKGYKMKNNVEIVLPLGVTGKLSEMPNKEYLIQCLKNLKEQTLPVKITIAMDENLQLDRKEIIEKYADKIKIFPKDSWFSPGSIWKKIVICWEESDCKYVGWTAYDDFSSLDRFELQYKQLEETDKNSSFCSNYIIENGNTRQVNDGNIDFISTIGNHALFVPAYLIRKDTILNSGLCNYKEKFSRYFEGLLNYFIIKTGIPISCPNAKFYRREHKGTLTETWREQWFMDSFKRTGYSPDQCGDDWNSIGFEDMCEKLKKELLK